MVQLNFNANEYTEEQVQDVHEEYKQRYELWMEQCVARKQAISAATLRWREAVEAAHEAKMQASRMRIDLMKLKSELCPPPPIKYV